LRAPINAVTLNLANIKDSLMELTDVPQLAEHGHTIEMLEDELRRLQRAVESLLAQTAPMSPDPETFDVRRVIEDLQFLLAAQARQQRLRLEVSLPPKPAVVTAQRDSIKQAVLNLVVNAFDATPKGGSVAIEVRCGDGRVSIIVADTGVGVPDEIAARLFEMQATTKRTGTGIGLHVARTAVEAAGGSLRLADTGPGGTTFEIRLPEQSEGFLGQ
jgi:signal transduction histidine kinase